MKPYQGSWTAECDPNLSSHPEFFGRATTGWMVDLIIKLSSLESVLSSIGRNVPYKIVSYFSILRCIYVQIPYGV